MKVQAIVYASNTGFTAQYAHMLSQQTGLPAYALADAAQQLPAKANVIYMSWLMAGSLVDYKKAAAQYNVIAACGVGLNATPEQAEKTRKASKIPAAVPLFPLQGGYDESKLTGMYKFIMKLVVKMLIKQISAKAEQTEEDQSMLNTLRHGGSYVKTENLKDITAWLQTK